jgi:hypothetical protein
MWIFRFILRRLLAHIFLFIQLHSISISMRVWVARVLSIEGRAYQSHRASRIIFHRPVRFMPHAPATEEENLWTYLCTFLEKERHVY